MVSSDESVMSKATPVTPASEQVSCAPLTASVKDHDNEKRPVIASGEQTAGGSAGLRHAAGVL
jgi:hypothetical protein